MEQMGGAGALGGMGGPGGPSFGDDEGEDEGEGEGEAEAEAAEPAVAGDAKVSPYSCYSCFYRPAAWPAALASKRWHASLRNGSERLSADDSARGRRVDASRWSKGGRSGPR